jgi:hypothetical protein
MKPVVPKPQRCAIYTRKSTEHNLDLEFNSLDAQREACQSSGAVMTSDDPQSFMDYWTEIDAALMTHFGIDTCDAGIEPDVLASAQEEGTIWLTPPPNNFGMSFCAAVRNALSQPLS